MSNQANVVLEGSFESFSLDEVLDVVSISRQCMVVVLSDDTTTGRIVVRSGRVLAAEAPPSLRGRQAFLTLYRSPGRSFAVHRREAGPTESLGSLTELIAEATREPLAQPAPVPVLEGRFADHTIDEVLDVIAMSRQRMQLTVFRASGSQATLMVKAGQVLWCEDPAHDAAEEEAFQCLVDDPGDRFVVARIGPSGIEGTPIGPLAGLLESARERTPMGPERREQVFLEGGFDAYPLDDVLATLALSRQTVELVLRDDRGTRGVLLLKAGMVVTALALRAGTERRQAFLDLYAEPGDGFVVLRRGAARLVGPPVGSLASLIAEAHRAAPRPAPPPTPDRELLLDGSLETFGLHDVLAVACLSRQCMDVRTRSGTSDVARVLVKAGRLLGAQHRGQSDPVRALAAMRDDPGATFTVHRVRSPTPLPRGVDLAAALEEAEELSAEAQATVVHRLVRPAPAEPAPEAGGDELAARVEEAVHALEALQTRVEALSQAQPRDDRWLVGAVLAVQLGTLLLVAAFLSSRLL